MRGLHHHRDELIGRLVDVDHVHLRARHHDVACLHFGHLQHAFDHCERVRIEQIVLVRAMQQFQKLLAVFRLTHDEGRKPLQEGAFTVCVVHRKDQGSGAGIRRCARSCRGSLPCPDRVQDTPVWLRFATRGIP